MRWLGLVYYGLWHVDRPVTQEGEARSAVGHGHAAARALAASRAPGKGLEPPPSPRAITPTRTRGEPLNCGGIGHGVRRSRSRGQLSSSRGRTPSPGPSRGGTAASTRWLQPDGSLVSPYGTLSPRSNKKRMEKDRWTPSSPSPVSLPPSLQPAKLEEGIDHLFDDSEEEDPRLAELASALGINEEGYAEGLGTDEVADAASELAQHYEQEEAELLDYMDELDAEQEELEAALRALESERSRGRRW